LFQVVTAVKAAVRGRVPVTAKVRLGFADKSLVKEIAQAVDTAGASALTVHARTKFEGYAPPAHWEFIREMKECVKLPVIANGDIWSVQDYLRCVEISGCESVALGRGLISRPTLAREIKAHLRGEELLFSDWSWLRQGFLPSFISRTLDYRGENYAIPRTKQLLKFLSREYSEARELFEDIKVCRRLEELQGVLNVEFAKPAETR
jgi:tRNA-dihydrouridine synthase C